MGSASTVDDLSQCKTGSLLRAVAVPLTDSGSALITAGYARSVCRVVC